MSSTYHSGIAENAGGIAVGKGSVGMPLFGGEFVIKLNKNSATDV